MKSIERLIDALTSGEVVAVVLAAVSSWGVTTIRQMRQRSREERAELGRLKFKQENAEATRTAIRDELGELKEELKPLIVGLKDEITDLRKWIAAVDERSHNALQIACTLEKTQSQWLRSAETQISAILSAENPTLVGGLFRNEDNENATKH